jgi:hypothetical protein
MDEFVGVFGERLFRISGGKRLGIKYLRTAGVVCHPGFGTADY